MPIESRKETIERVTMETVQDFLRESGIPVSVEWQRPDANKFPDYRAEVQGQRWAFEVTQLWELPSAAYSRGPAARTISDIGSRRRMYHVRTDALLLRELLERRITDKSKLSRLALLDGDSYCLVIVNGQFDDVDEWAGMANKFGLSAFDSVIIVHFPVSVPGNELKEPSGLRPVCEVWKNGFGTTLPEYTVGDLFPGQRVNCEISISARSDLGWRVPAVWCRVVRSGVDWGERKVCYFNIPIPRRSLSRAKFLRVDFPFHRFRGSTGIRRLSGRL